MRKESLKNILKEVKKGKDDMIGLTFNPTLEECDYLSSKNVAITKSQVSRQGLVSDYYYTVDTTDFVLDK